MQRRCTPTREQAKGINLTSNGENPLPLFRPEALGRARVEHTGTVIFIRAPSITLLALLGLIVTIGVLALMLFGTYTVHTSLVGTVEPDNGMVRVYPQRAGIVLQRLVIEGQKVRKGDALFLLAEDRMALGNSRRDHGLRMTAESLLSNIRNRKLQFEYEDRARQAVLSDQQTSITSQLDTLRAELAQMDTELRIQSTRLVNQQVELKRLEPALQQHYMSEVEYRQREDSVLSQQAAVEALSRSRLDLKRQITALEAELRTLPIQSSRDHAGLQQQLGELEQSELVAEGQAASSIISPCDGQVVAVLAESGQFVSGEPLVTIVPTGATLVAAFFAPSHVIGSIGVGDIARIRYRAYPYQQYGDYSGTVASVSLGPLSRHDLPESIAATADLPADEPVYRVIVTLASQQVADREAHQAIRSGLVIDAQIIHGKRRFLEWPMRTAY